MGRETGVEGSSDSASLDALRRSLAQSRAQCRSARSQIHRLAQRNAQLEKQLVALAHREQQARRLAHHDALTGLANRVLLQDRLGQAIARAQRGRRLVALLLIDLDGFKRINDRLGHAAGDRLLQAVGARLSASIRKADTVCRHGGDEFVIMLPELDDSPTVDAVMAKVRVRLCKPHVIDDHEIRITASVGTALYPRDGIGYAQLMKHADLAMYVAKAASCPAAIEGLLELAQAQDGGAPLRWAEGCKDVVSPQRSDETTMLESL